MRLIVTALSCLVLIAASGHPSNAQYVSLDVTNDGICNTDDFLNSDVSSIDVYLDTSKNADGSPATCAQDAQTALTISSYDIAFYFARASVLFQGWTDAMGFTTDLGSIFPTGYGYAWVRKGGSTTLPPGKYKLGTMAVAIGGDPIVCPAASLPGTPNWFTGFGSDCPGVHGDHVLQLSVDFTDACCTYVPFASTKTTWGVIKNKYW